MRFNEFRDPADQEPAYDKDFKQDSLFNQLGKVLDKIESTERGVIEIENYKTLKKTLFSRYGNKIFFYFLLFYIILIFFLKKREIK